ncbi:MAG: methylase, partial [Selenomonadaceae bacterium]|nr:methylase [Selenomonadaceae bacterium]
EVIREINRGSGIILDNPVKVTINQFYGIEINDFAVAVAKTALWIAESQMLQETEMIIHRDLNFLPLKNYAAIIEGNALQMDCNAIIDKSKLSYIIGNPPFVGYTYQTQTQKADLLAATQLNTKKIDYVVSWYYKAAQFIQNTNIRCAFVSTNSITQGEQVAIVWKPLIEKFNIHIDFAYRTFKWLSESKNMAAVHCVIIGFSCAKNRKPKLIYEDEQVYAAKNINAYLVDADNVFVESRSKPLCDVPNMITGNRPADGGNLIIEAADYKDFIKREPNAKKFIKRLIGAEEFINRKDRYCLWLVNASPDDIKSMPLVAERVEACRQKRLNSPKAATRKSADTSWLFQEIRQPTTNYIIVPRVSGGTRKYIPIGFIDSNYIVTDAVHVIPNAQLYHFGILMSSVHMAWTKTVCGRLKSDYRYSKDIVYNNFVWCKTTYEQHKRIEETALDILIARDKYPKASLADLYDEYKMPKNLRKAHQANDRAVLDAYGFDHSLTESEIVAELMKLYQQLTS